MPKNLTVEECEELGIKFPCNLMDNGEYRFRLMQSGQNAGYGYIMTVMPGTSSGWQNSHYHNWVMETYIVQNGWIGLAELLFGGQVKISVYRKDELFTTQPGSVHNVYMAAGAVIHTVKHGGDRSLEKDWFASPELDEKVKSLGEADIFQLAGVSLGG